MKEIVLNGCYGGFRLPDKVMDRYHELGGKEKWGWEVDRCDPILIQILKEFGIEDGELTDDCTELYIQEFDDRYNYRIEDYDGIESLHLKIREDVLRELIRKGDEEEIVEYVMGAQA